MADLVNRKPVQVEQVSVGGRGNKGGEAQASRDLGLSRPDVHRAIQVATIDPEAKTAAKAAGLDDNRTALLKVAKEPTAARQVEAVRSLAQQKMDSSIAAKTRQRATREVASIITKYVPPEFLPAVRANLAVCGPPSAIVQEIEILEAKAK